MRKFPFQIFNSVTHQPMPGQADNITVMLSKDGATPVRSTNTVTEVGNSYYTIQLTDSELNCTDFVEIDITCPNADKRQFAYTDEIEDVTKLTKMLYSGLYNWLVNGNTLTVYNNDNTVVGSYTITRDSDGVITRIQPING